MILCRLFCVCAFLSIPLIGQQGTIFSHEALAFKRITEFWKDGDLQNAKTQMLQYLKKYPQSSLKDHVLALLGDLYFKENKYEEALATYQQIETAEFKSKVFLNTFQVLFELKHYSSLIDIGQRYFKEPSYLSADQELTVRYLLAESLFHQGLGSVDPKVINEAKTQYELLAKTKYGNFSLHPLAEIYRLQKNPQRAAALYLILSEKQADKAEEFLFQAALMQIEFDKMLAAKTFAKITGLGGPLAEESAYNQLTLLFEANRYQDLLLLGELRLPENKVSFRDFYRGKSFYALGEYEKAIEPLQNFIKTQIEPTDYLKTAIYNLASCAQMTKNPQLFETTLAQLRLFFPQENGLLKWQLEHTKLCLEKQEPTTSILSDILHASASVEEKSSALFDYGQLLLHYKKWQESKASFLAFVNTYPLHEKAADAWRYLLQCSSQDSKEVFISDLQAALCHASLFPIQEQQEQRHLLAHLLYENKEYKETLKILEMLPETADVLLLTAFCHYNIDPLSTDFIEQGEKAIGHQADKITLHLQLFNAYLSYPGKEAEAAQHLFEAFSLKHPIKKENRWWMADHYYAKAFQTPKNVTAAEQSTLLFENLIKEEPTLEIAILKLAELYAFQGTPEKKVALLEELVEQYKNPNIEWKHQRQALFELAKGYEALNQKEKALALYDDLIHSSSHTSSYISDAAALQRARLQFSLLSEEEKREDHPKVAEILSALKDLQIKKNLHSEPLHLEAALEYVKVRSLLVPSAIRTEKTLFFLKRLKEDFYSQEDVIGQQYHELLKQLPEKEQLFRNYMQNVEVEIERLEKMIAQAEKP